MRRNRLLALGLTTAAFIFLLAAAFTCDKGRPAVVGVFPPEQPSPTPTIAPTATPTPDVMPILPASVRLRMALSMMHAAPTATPVPPPPQPVAPQTQSTQAPPPAPTQVPPPQPTPTPAPPPPPPVPAGERMVLATYYSWFDEHTWAVPCVGNFPLERYNSGDPNVIARHLQQAIGAGLDGFVVAWPGPGTGPDNNFGTLLNMSAGTNFRSTVHVETNCPQFRSTDDIVAALRYLIQNRASNPSFLRYGGKPVIFFTDMERVFRGPGPVSVAEALEGWRSIRQQVDPNHDTIWIAEGVSLAYQDVFDGHYLLNTIWANGNYYSSHYKWGNAIRQYNAANGTHHLWVAAAVPGWNDLAGLTNSACPTYRTGDPKVTLADRRGGALFREFFAAAVQSQPDIILVTSFNEWVEGRAIEPSVDWGDPNLYLNLTRELVATFK